MAKKTNKTAHVLNLLSGNNNQKTAKSEATPETTEKSTPVVSNVKMDSNDKEDVVSDLIHQQLLSELMDSNPEPESDFALENELIPESDTVPEENFLPIPELPPEEEPVVEVESALEEKPIADEHLVSESNPVPEVEPVLEREPEFVVLNIMERIVQDKIIYFMRQFEVCTCERCIADTVALTLNGLQPKYIVTTPAAVAPLISFYTNKYISDITVEATKACQTIKDNPRH